MLTATSAYASHSPYSNMIYLFWHELFIRLAFRFIFMFFVIFLRCYVHIVILMSSTRQKRVWPTLWTVMGCYGPYEYDYFVHFHSFFVANKFPLSSLNCSYFELIGGCVAGCGSGSSRISRRSLSFVIIVWHLRYCSDYRSVCSD